VEGLEKVRLKLKGQYESKIDQILFRIDDKNGTVQQHLQAAYMVYWSAPCEKLEHFEGATVWIREAEADMRLTQSIVAELTALLTGKNRISEPAVQHKVTELLEEVVVTLNRHRTPREEIIAQMQRSTRNVEEWRRP
jgi:hypothetical protein